MSISQIIASIILVLLVWAIGNFGKDTPLGIWGSIGLAICTTPVVAFLIISIAFKKDRARLHKIYRAPRK